MEDRKIEAYAVLVAEWVIGDIGVPVRLGEHVSWQVRPAEDGDGGPAARLLAQDRVAAGQPEIAIFALHADDPEPTTTVVGHVTLIRALQWSHPPDGELRLLSQQLVPEARIAPEVADYLIQVEGTVSVRH